MNELIAIYFGIVGLFIGSFLNVVAFRTLEGSSFAKGRSHCPSCQTTLGVIELIPVASYLIQRGKCRSCQAKLSVLYPFGEAITGIGFFAATWVIGLRWELLVALFFISVLVTVTQTDLRERLIPDRIVFPALGTAALLRVWVLDDPYWTYLLSSIGSFLLFYAIAVLGSLLLKKDAMGGGDIKLYLFVGTVLGWPSTAVSVFFASLAGTIYGYTRLMVTKQKAPKSRELPFGPFIALGGMIAYLWGESFLTWYLGLYH